MIYLGIDVAKSSPVTAALTSEGEVVLEPFSFANSARGFSILKEKLQMFANFPLLIGLESTAQYSENLIYFLCGNGYHVAMLDPLQTAAIRESTIRKTKTDKADAFLIAKFLIIDGYTELQQTNVQLLKLKGLYKSRQNLILMRTRCKIQGTDSPALVRQIQQAVAQIELFSSQIKQVDAEISSIMDNLASPIMTTPGIGHLNGTMILSCIGNIQRFSSPGKLLAYSGLDPPVIQLGNFSARSTRTSKRGNSMLRYALINAAHNVVLNNDTFARYYNSKVTQGKSHYCALGHTAHTLIRVHCLCHSLTPPQYVYTGCINNSVLLCHFIHIHKFPINFPIVGLLFTFL